MLIARRENNSRRKPYEFTVRKSARVRCGGGCAGRYELPKGRRFCKQTKASLFLILG